MLLANTVVLTVFDGLLMREPVMKKTVYDVRPTEQLSVYGYPLAKTC